MPQKLENLVKKIVRQANELKNAHTTEKRARVNYSAVFCQNMREYESLLKEAQMKGNMLVESETGQLFHLPAIKTVAGPLKIVKVRKPSKFHPELGDADFTVKSYPAFKRVHATKPGFKLMKRQDYEMIELMDQSFKVRAYFSNKPIDRELGI